VAIILLSKCCTEGVRFQGGVIPTRCPRCLKVCGWIGTTVDEPKLPYRLTFNDIGFLKGLRIQAIEPIITGTVES
jgi:hypothetical protein